MVNVLSFTVCHQRFQECCWVAPSIEESDKNLPCPLHPKTSMQTHTSSMVSVHLSAWQLELGFSGLDRGGRLHDCVRGRTPGEGGERSSAGRGSRRRERITPPGGRGWSREWS